MEIKEGDVVPFGYDTATVLTVGRDGSTYRVKAVVGTGDASTILVVEGYVDPLKLENGRPVWVGSPSLMAFSVDTLRDLLAELEARQPNEEAA